jgi:hypothetical protein
MIRPLFVFEAASVVANKALSSPSPCKGEGGVGVSCRGMIPHPVRSAFAEQTDLPFSRGGGSVTYSAAWAVGCFFGGKRP